MRPPTPSRPSGQIFLFVVFGALWLFAVLLHVRGLLGGGFSHPAVYVRASEASGSDPVFAGFLGGKDWGDFQPGDSFRALVTEDAHGGQKRKLLAGYGPYGFFALVQNQIPLARRDETGQPVLWLDGSRAGSGWRRRLPLAAESMPWRMLPVTVTVFLIGALVLYKKPREPFGVAFFVAAACFSIHWTWFFGASRTGTFLWMAIYPIVSALMYPFALRTAVTFPRRLAPDPFPWWFWLFAVNGPVALTASVGAPLPPACGVPGILVLNLAVITTLIALLVRRYRSVDQYGQRQLRWCVLGLLLGLTPMMALNLVAAATGGELWWLIGVGAAFEVLIPVCIGIGILNASLFDIDRIPWTPILQANCAIIAASLGVASASHLDAWLRLVPATAGSEQLLKAALVLALAVVGFLLPPRLRRTPEFEDMVSGVLRLSDPELLPTAVAGMLARQFKPASCIVYRESRELLIPVHGSGDAAELATLPNLPRDGTLHRLMANSLDALSLEILRPTPPELHLLDRYRPEVMVPFGTGAVLLGQRGTGDHYSAADFRLLSTIAALTRSQLERFGAAPDRREKRVFVSHASKDRQIADSIVRGLKTRGVSSWYSPDDLQTMDQWSERIRSEVRSAAALVAILSPSANASPWVAVEIETARASGIPICPFVASTLPPEPERKPHLQYALEFQSTEVLDGHHLRIAERLIPAERRLRARIDALTDEVVRALAEGRAG
jgi:hypothetical protein